MKLNYICLVPNSPPKVNHRLFIPVSSPENTLVLYLVKVCFCLEQPSNLEFIHICLFSPAAMVVVVAFSSRARILGECSTIYSPTALFFFLFKVEISSRKLIPLFRPDQSTLAQRDETTVTDCSLASCVWARFLIDSHTLPEQRLDGSRVYASLGVTCHLHFWQNNRDFVRATAVTRGWNGHRIRVSTQS